MNKVNSLLMTVVLSAATTATAATAATTKATPASTAAVPTVEVVAAPAAPAPATTAPAAVMAPAAATSTTSVATPEAAKSKWGGSFVLSNAAAMKGTDIVVRKKEVKNEDGTSKLDQDGNPVLKDDIQAKNENAIETDSRNLEIRTFVIPAVSYKVGEKNKLTLSQYFHAKKAGANATAEDKDSVERGFEAERTRLVYSIGGLSVLGSDEFSSHIRMTTTGLVTNRKIQEKELGGAATYSVSDLNEINFTLNPKWSVTALVFPGFSAKKTLGANKISAEQVTFAHEMGPVLNYAVNDYISPYMKTSYSMAATNASRFTRSSQSFDTELGVGFTLPAKSFLALYVDQSSPISEGQVNYKPFSPSEANYNLDMGISF